MSKHSRFLPCVLATLVVVPLGAIMSLPMVRQVPVERLVANLERIAKEQPRSAQAQINLARLHVMAFIRNADALDAYEARDADGKQTVEIPYYEPGAPTIPRGTVAARAPERSPKAAGHLKQAVQHYEAALKLEPDNMVATLGRGWVRQQLGDRAGAIEDYRRAIAGAWMTESKSKMLMPSQRYLTQEAIDYLLPLLDAKRDAAEIQDLLSKQTDMKNRPRAITPVALPLDDQATVSDIVDRRARVRFDADGSALDREWTWITPRAGWLVYDAYGRGEITSALQLFGNVTFWLFWNNGYEALSSLDDDANGRLEREELRHLAIWHDANVNGRSDKGEVQPLAAHGIASLSCDYLDGDGNYIAASAPHGATLSNGQTRPTYDVILHQSPASLTRR